MSDCLFCRIVAGDVPSDKVHETERTVAFRDINPAAPTHVLVVPREHIESAAAVEAGHGEVLADVGEDALNSVPHLHLHVLGGRPMGWPPG